MITPKGMDQRGLNREKSSAKPLGRHSLKPSESNELDLERKIFGILSEKFITPFYDQFEKFEREMNDKYEKLKKDVQRLDF